MGNLACLFEDSEDAALQDSGAEYEAEMIEEARRIVAGRSMLLPSREHLRVLLVWLDGREPERKREEPAWDAPGAPF